MGKLALDGTKTQANASRYNLLIPEYASKIESQLKAEVADLLVKAGIIDWAAMPDAMRALKEPGRSKKRLAEAAQAKAAIEARVYQRDGPRL